MHQALLVLFLMLFHIVLVVVEGAVEAGHMLMPK